MFIQAISLCSFAFLLLSSQFSCQVEQIGRFNSEARQIYFGKRADSGMSGSKFKIQVPFHDSKLLLKEANDLQLKQEATASILLKSTTAIHSAPLSFAKSIPVEIDSRSHGIWEEDSSLGIRTWSVFIESKSALGIALIFDQFRIFEDGEMYAINDSGILGAFTRANNKPDGKFSIQHLKGSSVFLIYIEPAFKPVAKPLNYFKISKVVHAFRDIFDEKALSGSCNVDARCVSLFNDQKRATIVFMTDQLQKFCTGAMINNAKGDGSQLMITANHCVFTDLSNSIAGFNYEKLACSSDNSASLISNPQTAHGMKLLARGSDSDFALFEVVEKIPASYNVYMAGWDANVPNLTVSDSFAGIHHPSGDVKKISLYTGKLQLSTWSEGPGKAFHVTIPKWTRGVTEPGSSGSPLFNSKGSFIGQLHGGASSCGNLAGSDLYGGFAFSFNSLKSFLDPNGVVKSLVLPGKNLNTGTSPSGTVTSTITATVTAIAACPCVPKAVVDKLMLSYEARINLLESIGQ